MNYQILNIGYYVVYVGWFYTYYLSYRDFDNVAHVIIKNARRSSIAPYTHQETQMSLTNRATHLRKGSSVADLAVLIPIKCATTPNLVVLR